MSTAFSQSMPILEKYTKLLFENDRIPEELFQKYNSNGIYSVNRDKYEYQLKKACKETGQAWNGSHGLRHNYAQNRMNELSGRMSYGEAMLQTSKEMGHHRMEITQKYLR